MEKIKCPKCDSQARICRGVTTTLLASTPYYDDKGKCHDNNVNTTTYYWTCLKCGHEYKTEIKPDKRTITITEPKI